MPFCWSSCGTRGFRVIRHRMKAVTIITSMPRGTPIAMPIVVSRCDVEVEAGGAVAVIVVVAAVGPTEDDKEDVLEDCVGMKRSPQACCDMVNVWFPAQQLSRASAQHHTESPLLS